MVANEAYLNTARQRISVRRHARLVDYFLHEGCNARAFVHFALAPQTRRTLSAGHSRLFTQPPGIEAAVIEPGSEHERAARNAGVLVFETVHEKQLSESLNELHFYTWGDEECCLPRGATSATLEGHAEGLAARRLPGIRRKRKSPTRLTEEDADRKHRHVVRLTRVEFTGDPSGKLFGPEAGG